MSNMFETVAVSDNGGDTFRLTDTIRKAVMEALADQCDEHGVTNTDGLDLFTIENEIVAVLESNGFHGPTVWDVAQDLANDFDGVEV